MGLAWLYDILLVAYIFSVGLYICIYCTYVLYIRLYPEKFFRYSRRVSRTIQTKPSLFYVLQSMYTI